MTKLTDPVVVNHYPHKDGWENDRELADAQTRLTDVTENGSHGTLVWAADGKTFWRTGVKEGKLTHVKGPYTLPNGRVAPEASEPNLELVYGIAEAIELAHGKEVAIDWDQIQVIGPRGLETFDFENDPELIESMRKIQDRLERRNKNPFVDALTNEVSGLLNIPNRFHQGKKKRFEELGKKVETTSLEKEYRPDDPQPSASKTAPADLDDIEKEPSQERPVLRPLKSEAKSQEQTEELLRPDLDNQAEHTIETVNLGDDQSELQW